MSVRRLEPELMDDPALDASGHRHALQGLARLNAVSRADAPIWRALAPHLRRGPQRLLDVATGSADVLLRLARRARKASLDLSIAGCDQSEVALAAARQRADDLGLASEFFQLDAINDSMPDGYDVITCSLFLHHLSAEDATSLLARMAGAAPTLIVADLRRTTFGFALASIAPRLATRSYVVHTDAVLSAHAAFSLTEFRSLANDAALHDARIAPTWPSRMLLVRNAS